MNKTFFKLIVAAAVLSGSFSHAEENERAEQSTCPTAFAQIGTRIERGRIARGGHAPIENAPVLSFKAQDNTWISTMDLKWIGNNPFSNHARLFRQADEDRKIAYRRLEKYQSPAAVANAENLDRKLASRSVYVMNTKNPVDKQQSRPLGGIRAVFASVREQLPWETDLGVKRISRKVAVEIGRLHADTASNPQRSAELILAAVKASLKNPEVEDFYLHTSKFHSRLYKRMGLKPQHEQVIDDENHVWQFDRAYAEELVQNGFKSSRLH